MSWQERIETNMIITTGDGRTWPALWIDSNKSKGFNITEFEFDEVAGALVKRKKPKARRFDIEIYFQGDDHLDTAAAFERSLDDERALQIAHPKYGDIIVQPTSVEFDDRVHNVTKVIMPVIETILEENPRATQAVEDQIEDEVNTTNAALAASFANDVTPDSSDINVMTENNAKVYNDGTTLVSTDEESADYFNAFNSANSSILNATAEPLTAIVQMQAVINTPALFAQSVRARFNLFRENLNKLRINVPTTTKKSEKVIYENNGGTVLTSMCLAAANPQDDDYANINEVLELIAILLAVYDQYIQDLDLMQSDNGGQPDSYIPNAAALEALSTLVNLTTSGLFTIALDAKQERFIYLESDSNVIILAHRFYGLQADDSTITQMIKENNIGINEYLRIKKGRRIVYYV
jgi:hypothetical protein